MQNKILHFGSSTKKYNKNPIKISENYKILNTGSEY